MLDGEPQSFDLSDMLLDATARPARLVIKQRPRPGQPINGIEIEFTAGFGSALEVPPELKRGDPGAMPRIFTSFAAR